jgi:four helix bundle protein
MAVAKKLEELVCWQLADELRRRVRSIVVEPAVAKDVEFCRQVRKSSRGAPALIAEGYARQTNPEFVHYLRMALGEVAETCDHLRDGLEAGHLSADAFRELWRLCFRTRRCCSRLIETLLKKIEGEKRNKRRRKHSPDAPDVRT